MRKTLALLLVVSSLIIGVSAFGVEHPQLKAFPAEKEGMERFIIVLTPKGLEEDNFMVELIVGKTMLTDGVNQIRLGNVIEPRPLKGWGYTYYEVTGVSVPMTTLIAVPEGTPKVEKFVYGSPLKVRYNSRLPIVVYVPDGYEVQYRIWNASEITEKAEKG